MDYNNLIKFEYQRFLDLFSLDNFPNMLLYCYQENLKIFAYNSKEHCAENIPGLELKFVFFSSI